MISPVDPEAWFQCDEVRWIEEMHLKRAALEGRFWTRAHEAKFASTYGMPSIAYEGNNILVEHDEVCALAAVLQACVRSQDGLIPLTEMIRVGGAVSMTLLERGHEAALSSAIPHMASRRCPYAIMADRYLSEREVQEMARAQGWPGEFIVLQTLKARGWVHFSDPRAALVARMMLCGGGA